MNQKQKGGIILPFKDSVQNANTLRNYLLNSDVTYLSKGSYGLTLSTYLVVNPPPTSNWKVFKDIGTGKHFYVDENDLGSTRHLDIPEELENPEYIPFSNYYKRMAPDETFGSPVYNLVIKLCLISDNENETVENVFGSSLHSVNEEDFVKEINIQTDIFLKTMQYLQPIAPSIVYSSIFDDKALIQFLLTTLSKKSGNDLKLNQALGSINFKLSTNPDCKLGIIAMETAFGDTLASVERKYMRQPDLVNILQNITRYTLLKLALDTEYNHNDFHKYNIIMTPNTDYFEQSIFTAQVIILDYGRADKIPPEIMKKIREAVKEKKYTKALTYLCDKSYAYPCISEIKHASRYGWICGDYNLTDADYDTVISNLVAKANGLIRKYNADPMHFPKRALIDETYVKGVIPKPNQLSSDVDNMIAELFEDREQKLNKLAERMKELHDKEPNRYPLLPISNQMKNEVYNGLIGGKHKKTRYRRNKNKNKKSLKH